ncbi:hypothetical protein [Piscirickettsia salmonis]|uniref:hypothetical protein n=1 Tax=Piscirickettsia salmonis TaxID=1238 RepID=UPI000332D3A4|nr:hypothetical protein [Piscirickettsia salmonis]ERL61430.1 hypothetical protein K661_02231 [Piscirickettsia salmonis LF-89 = ATCC VR-1361]PEQ17605.1 hypothetical protein X973_01215 [Piscirickettsia salmonis]QNR79602.1 hypothetical protein ICC15_11240 [Piscirickettsia salmonis]WGZ71162.1 hypothetical protein E3220_05605 [Piscirickettsia salmonis EM-90]
MLKKRLKPILATLGILLTVTSATEVSALTAAEFKATKLPYSVMAYSNQYAHEYGLDAGKAVELSKGLEAIKLILYKKHYPEGGGWLLLMCINVRQSFMLIKVWIFGGQGMN